MPRDFDEGTGTGGGNPPSGGGGGRRGGQRVPTRPGGGGPGSGGSPPPSTPPSNPTPDTPAPGKDPYLQAQKDAQAAADKKEMDARKRASRQWLGRAETMQQQIDALKSALGKNGLKKALKTQLHNVGVVLRQQDAQLMSGYRQRMGALRDTAEDNEKAEAGQSQANLTNRGRERANAISEATLQGAGESDMLRAQGASLRNWNANQNEISRSFFDTLTSINSSRTDLNVDTQTGRENIFNQANADRSGLWTEYYGNRSEVLTALGNAYGQQAEYYGLANEAIPKKSVRQDRNQASDKSGDWMGRASKVSGMAWENPGVPQRIRAWKGAGEIEGYLNTSDVGNVATEVRLGRPEGATLRNWRS
jgi:hypothetical protein